MAKKKISITTSSFGQYDKEPLQLIEKAGYQYALNPFGRKLKAEEVVSFAGDAIGMIAGVEDLTANVLKQLPNIKVISRCGVGMDSVDLKAAKDLSIDVFNTAEAPTVAVAELTVGMVFSLLREITFMDRAIRAGQWNKRMGYLLAGKNVGIIGYGRIGQKVGEMISHLNGKVGFYDLFVKTSSYGQYMDINELYTWADIICVHVAKSNDGYLIDQKQINQMKKGAYLINCARGGLINEKTLYQALKSGQLAGAALDVFEDEPYQGPLKELENVILTPHIGSYAKEARIAMEKESVYNLLQGLNKRGV